MKRSSWQGSDLGAVALAIAGSRDGSLFELVDKFIAIAYIASFTIASRGSHDGVTAA